MIHPDGTPESFATHPGEMSEAMSHKITACYLKLVQEFEQKKEDDKNAILCILTERVIQSAVSILRSTDAEDL